MQPAPSFLEAFPPELLILVSHLHTVYDERERRMRATIVEESDKAVARHLEKAAQDRLVGAKEGAQIASNMSEKTLLEWRRRGLLAGQRAPGTRSWLFRVSDILAAIKTDARPDGQRRYSRKSSAPTTKKGSN